ncbi:MAG: hypothetical protein CMO01_18600 [Thalassobius sp.]|nr:hypothetical protein [Thalassovita sp.]
MEKHFQLSDAVFELQFEEGRLDPAMFSHEAHLRLAWIHLHNYGMERACNNICCQIKNYASQLGLKDKYNKTVTVAAIKAVYHFMLKSSADNFKDFIRESPRLKNAFKDLIDSHYGFDIFKSEKAKKEYLEPDLLPFD